jgi:hypothetical protein
MPCSLSLSLVLLTSTSDLLWVFSSSFGPREKKKKTAPTAAFSTTTTTRRWVQGGKKGRKKESGTASGID